MSENAADRWQVRRHERQQSSAAEPQPEPQQPDRCEDCGAPATTSRQGLDRVYRLCAQGAEAWDRITARTQTAAAQQDAAQPPLPERLQALAFALLRPESKPTQAARDAAYRDLMEAADLLAAVPAAPRKE